MVSLIALPITELSNFITSLTVIMMVGIFLEGIDHIMHARYMKTIKNEDAASYYLQTSQYGKSYLLRNSLLALRLLLYSTIMFTEIAGSVGVFTISILIFSTLIKVAFGRSLFLY